MEKEPERKSEVKDREHFKRKMWSQVVHFREKEKSIQKMSWALDAFVVY